MRVILSYSFITIEGAPKWLDSIGRYRLRSRKSPEEMRAEKERKKANGYTSKVVPYRFEDKSVMERDAANPDTLYFMPGLWPRVKENLDRRSIEYEIVDKRDPSKKPPLDLSVIEGMELRTGQDVAMALIATMDCGIIETTVGWGKSHIISVLCKALPTLHILVCTDSTSVVKTLYEYLLQQIPGEVGILTGEKDTTKGKRVIVSTMRSLPKIPADGPDLIFCDECHCCGDNLASKDIARFYFARRFGFSATPIRNDGAQIVMESLFGPTILKMDYDSAVDAGMVVPMKYVLLPCNTCPSCLYKMQDPQDYLLKRFSYWSNAARNRAIADLMHELKDTGAQVLIVVATLEHAIRLWMMMPWLVVAYYGSADMEELQRHFPKSKYPNLDLSRFKSNQKQLDITRRAFAKGTLRAVVSTYVFRQGTNFTHLQVLIRADGTTSAIAGVQIPGRLSRLDEGKDCAYLVDFADTFTDWAARRADTRVKLYNEQGWTEVTKEEMLNDLRAKSHNKPDDVVGETTTEA